MEILNNYLEYRKHKPEYKQWQAKRKEQTAKKEQYLKENPVSEEEKQRQTQKIKIVLDAVDTMDEFSQKKAENAEIATQIVKGTASQVASYAGLGLGSLIIFSKTMRNKIDSIEKTNPMLALLFTFSPMILSSLASLLITTPLVSWATKGEIFASKIGRHEAVTTQLNSENQFALLNDEQIKEAEEKAKTITLDDKENNMLKGFKEAFATTKNLFGQNQEVKDYLKNENEKFEAHKKNFDTKISENDTKTAKEEQQMITQIVEEIDKASQDYAEDVEFGTNSFMAAATALGIGETALGTWILNKLKVKNKIVSVGIPAAIGMAAMLASGVFAAKIQKQSSRVARFKVMQDLEKNPERLLYVDEEKINNNTQIETKDKKKENLLQFYLRLYNENKEYNEYIKKNGDKNKKFKLALNEIKLTDKQKADAKQLQANVFKTFNKIDDKSQTYSESTEALGELAKTYGSLLSVLAGCAGSIAVALHVIKRKSDKAFASIIPIYASLVPALALDAYVTKEQKQSSRVAHMLAIKDLEDYKHFVDYDNLEAKNQENKTEEIKTEQTQAQEQGQKIKQEENQKRGQEQGQEQSPIMQQLENTVFSEFNLKK